MNRSRQLYFPDSDGVTNDYSKVCILEKITFNMNETEDVFSVAAKIFKESFANVEIGIEKGGPIARVYKPIKEQFILRLPNRMPIPLEIIAHDFGEDENDEYSDSISIEIARLIGILKKSSDLGVRLDLRRQIRALKNKLGRP